MASPFIGGVVKELDHDFYMNQLIEFELACRHDERPGERCWTEKKSDHSTLYLLREQRRLAVSDTSARRGGLGPCLGSFF